MSSTNKKLVIIIMASLFTSLSCGLASAYNVVLPDPILDESKTKATGTTVVLAGGCFWGIQAVFRHVKGITSAVSGYAGGDAQSAHYNIVGTGTTGHAEAVQLTYNPAQITLGTILKIFFAVAHDPTELNRQGPDQGTQYRSAIFYATPEQQEIAQTYIDQLQKAKIFSDAIATKLEPMNGFYPAEDYHQDYFTMHPMNPYILINDAPKVARLKKQFPELYKD